jgi:hypothetical protein
MQENLQSTVGQDHSSPPVAVDMLIVLCTFPDHETARRISKEIITENLAACVNLISGMVMAGLHSFLTPRIRGLRTRSFRKILSANGLVVLSMNCP